MIIETERLLMREMTMDDLDALKMIFTDPETMRFYPCAFDDDGVRLWISRNIERYGIFGFGLYSVVLKEDGRVIGDAGVTMQNVAGVIRPEIGYHIAREYQRRGFAKEAAAKWRDVIFDLTPFNRLYSYMASANIASLNTALSTGMKLELEYTDGNGVPTSVCSIDRDEWIAAAHGKRGV